MLFSRNLVLRIVCVRSGITDPHLRFGMAALKTFHLGFIVGPQGRNRDHSENVGQRKWNFGSWLHMCHQMGESERSSSRQGGSPQVSNYPGASGIRERTAVHLCPREGTFSRSRNNSEPCWWELALWRSGPCLDAAQDREPVETFFSLPPSPWRLQLVSLTG